MSNKEFFTDRGYEIAEGENSLTPSMEDYMEMIYRLSESSGYTRVSRVAESLNVQPASVTRMAKKLADKDLLCNEKYGMIHLTDKGWKLGKYLLDRHHLLEEFFHLIGAGGNLQKEVERIEHHISQENYQILTLFVQFLKNHPELLEDFYKFRNLQLSKFDN